MSVSLSGEELQGWTIPGSWYRLWILMGGRTGFESSLSSLSKGGLGGGRTAVIQVIYVQP